RFTIADVSVLPRIAIAPFAGMLSSRWEKSEYPLLTQYVRDLGERPSFAASSDSGRLVRAIASWIPWGLIQWLGNWRSGRELEHINGETVLRELRQQCPAQRDVRVASVEQATLYLPEKGPRAKAARLALGILNPKLCIVRTLSDLSLRGRGIELRNVQNIIEFMDTAPDGELSCLIPDAPLQRCQVRMLHGMFETCLSYHYEPLVNGKELKAEEIEAYQTGLRQQLLFLEERLKQGRYLVGNGLTSADLAFYSLVQSLAELKVPIPLGDFPELLNWMTRLAPLAVLATQSS
ncbi:MAG: glutathione S-transferase family protein, partial [Chlamydiia bacterium]|nr:glutathione S-transferase family protein [Chlamydiia bacterium]